MLASRFRNAHAVAKRGRPLTDSVWICEAMAAQGVDVGSTYLNEKACAKLLTFIADAETDKRIWQVEASPYFSIMMDGSQDRSGLEQESIYIRTAVEGNVTERFLTMGQVPFKHDLSIIQYCLSGVVYQNEQSSTITIINIVFS